MVKQLYKNNALHIQADLLWLGEVMKRRFEFQQSSTKKTEAFKMPQLTALKGDSVYQAILEQFKFTAAERLVLILALVPHIAPYFLDETWIRINGSKEQTGNGISRTGSLPVVDLALFLLAGDDLEKRFYYQQVFEEDSFLIQNRIILVDYDNSGLQLLQNIKISSDYLSLLTQGKPYRPRFSSAFPAKKIETGLEWKDLILNPHIKTQVEEIKSWIRYGKVILQEWGLHNRLSPGYKILFYGPPGTGKTLTAALLAKESGVDVFRIDLSMVVSKYIGETEKNLSRIFDEADKKDWILFFDEADAIFGKRTEMKDAHDRYANQEVAYLLQKFEDHNGVVILSSNMKSNIDDAFTRRFQGVIYFPMPTKDERLQIWRNAFSKKTILEKEVSLDQLSAKYEMSGGAIMNVIRYASLKAMERKKNIIELKDLMNGIAREFAKEGRTI